MGYGIYFRHLRCTASWRPHLENSAQFIKDAASEFPDCSELVVLGAGRLLDLDAAWAGKRFSKIVLLDADPSLVSHWKKLFRGTQLSSFNLDVTDAMDRWSEVLAERPERLPDLEAPAPAFSIPPGSLVVSLNLLSQLPIYWRDRVLKKKAVMPPLSDILENQYASLQEQHLAWLARSEAAGIVVVTDLNFDYYSASISGIQREAALYGNTGKILQDLSHVHELISKKSWFWDLAPEGIEQVGYGERHEVVAYCFGRK